jgi:sialate O-acetylesterase
MIVQAKNRIAITDVLVGEVWLASGQSNMEFALSQTDRAKEDIAASANPMLRQFKVTKADGPVTQETCRGYWDVSSPATAGRFSAVAYYFGLALQRELHVPVGLISSNFGGSNIESWLSPQAVASLPSIAPIAAERIREATTYPARLQQYRADYAAWQSRYHREDPDTAGPHVSPPVLSDKDATVHLPGDVTGGDPKLANGGSIWLSRTVTVPENAAGTYLPVNLGKVSEFEQVFWDGVRFGSTTAEDSDAVISSDRTEYGRRYDVPGDRVKSGTATITVRLFNPIGPPAMEGVPRADGVKFDGAWHMRVEATEPPIDAAARASFPTRLPTAPSGRSLPTQLFNTMIHPLIPYAIRGVIWYQGEANVSHGYGYREEFPALIRDWRAQWKEGDFPFYFCEISNYGPHVTQPRESPEAELRESQSLALALPNTGEAITIDLGEEADIHYRNKQPVGLRLARLALAGTYGKSVQSSGPVFKSMKVEGHAVRIAFLHAEGGLIARPIPATYMPKSSTGKSVPLLRPSPQSQLEGFAICGDDRVWHWANAHLDGDTVIVSSPEVSKPIAVRYAWAENPITNLYNRDGLPAAPFRTDTFPVSTQDRRYGF